MQVIPSWADLELKATDTLRMVNVIPIRWADWLAFEIVCREAARVNATALECKTAATGYTMAVTIGGPSSGAVEAAHAFNDAVRVALENTPGAWPP